MRQVKTLLAALAVCLLPVSVKADPIPTFYYINTQAVTSGSAYAAGNEVGGLMNITLPLSASSGILQSVQINVKSAQSNAYKLYCFNSNPSNSTWTDKVTPAINVNDLFKAIGPFNIASYDNGLGTGTWYNLSGIGAAFGGLTNSTLYCVLITTAAVTYTSTSDVYVILEFLPG